MKANECLSKMVLPSHQRPGKPLGGVIQIWVTRSCDKSCFNCTQGSNLRGPYQFISLDQFEAACYSLKDYFGIVGVFGGNPAVHPEFPKLCQIIRAYIPKERCGLWCNNPLGRGSIMRGTFNPAVSNLNVHLDQRAYNEFRKDWPEARPFGLHDDSRHAPVYVALKDVLKIPCPNCNGVGMRSDAGGNPQHCQTCEGKGKVYDEEKGWELISNCDINKHWSAMIGVFRGELRGWFCEIAGSQAMLNQNNPDYPDTGIPIPLLMESHNRGVEWWQEGLGQFKKQIEHHCHRCGVPLRGYGSLAQGTDGVEQVSQEYAELYQLKKKDRPLQVVSSQEELKAGSLDRFTNYMQNANK